MHTCVRTYRHTDLQTYRRTDVQTYRYRHTYRHTDIQTYRHTDIQTYRHTDIQTYRHTGRTDIRTVLLHLPRIHLLRIYCHVPHKLKAYSFESQSHPRITGYLDLEMPSKFEAPRGRMRPSGLKSRRPAVLVRWPARGVHGPEEDGQGAESGRGGARHVPHPGGPRHP